MSSSCPSTYLFDSPGRYQIRVIGALDEKWLYELQDFRISVTHKKDGSLETKLSGWLADQTALAGLLDLLNDLGLVIISVKRLKMEKQT